MARSGDAGESQSARSCAASAGCRPEGFRSSAMDVFSCSDELFESHLDGVMRGWLVLRTDFEEGFAGSRELFDRAEGLRAILRADVHAGSLRLALGDGVAPEEQSAALAAMERDRAAWLGWCRLPERASCGWLMRRDGTGAATAREKVRFIELMDACCMVPRSFAPLPAGVEVPRVRAHCYGGATVWTVCEEFADDGGFLSDPEPAGKEFGIRSREGTCATVVPLEPRTDKHGVGYWSATGSVPGYFEEDGAAKLMLYGRGGRSLDHAVAGIGPGVLAVSVLDPGGAVPAHRPLDSPRWGGCRREAAALDAAAFEQERTLLEKRIGADALAAYGDERRERRARLLALPFLA